jgi:GT2 family glycosyltransferase
MHLRSPRRPGAGSGGARPMPEIAAIMPCRGRAEQTVRNVRRLLKTAGPCDWRLICVVDGDPDVLAALAPLRPDVDLIPSAADATERVGYWRALAVGTGHISDAPLLCSLANDVLGGAQWLTKGLAAYRARFGSGDGLMGFSDGIHGPELATHFLIGRALLARYGGWPVWYRHNGGDRELSERAQQDGCYGKAPWAVLFHDHWLLGAPHDDVYAQNTATMQQDRALFQQRKAAGWPAIS